MKIFFTLSLIAYVAHNQQFKKLITNKFYDLTGHNPIMIENKIIDEVEKGTFLCIIVQIYLKWRSHIQYVANKINKKCGIIYLNKC